MRVYLEKLIKKDLGDAQDNLYRAKLSASPANIHKQWGNNGRTLGEIISGYAKWETEAKEALEWVKKNVAPAK